MNPDMPQGPADPAGEALSRRVQSGATVQQGDLGGQSFGQPVTRVDFFRRMPTGGTAYLKPAEPEA